MKKFNPSLEELVDRYAYQIQVRHLEIPISKEGKLLLKESWRGKEQKLYSKVKEMENKQIQYENLKKRIDHRVMETQIGVDFLGFPIYLVHEVIFENDTEHKYKVDRKVSNQKFMNSRSYLVKQH